MSKMCVDIKVGETLTFDNGRIRIRLEKKSGQRARLTVEADESTVIHPPRRHTADAANARMSALHEETE